MNQSEYTMYAVSVAALIWGEERRNILDNLGKRFAVNYVLEKK